MSLKVPSYALAVALSLAAVFGPSVALGAPSVSGISGVLAHGNTVTVSGSGFGTKATVAPYRWDDFENGTPGSLVTGWSGGVGADIARYADTERRGASTKSSAHPYRQTGESNISLCANGTYPLLYIDYWTKYRQLANPSRNWKHLRLYGNNDQLQLTWVVFGDASGLLNLYDSGDSQTEWFGWSAQQDRWYHHQLIFRESDVGVPNGTIRHYLDGVPDSMFGDTYVTRLGDYHFDQIRIGHYWATDSDIPYGGVYPDNPGGDVYVDDLYIDTTWARVEIGNASTYAASTEREIQIPSAWSDAALALTANLGQFANGPAYLYVFDSTGAVNAAGYPVTIGGTPDTTPPVAPSGLGIQ